MTIQYREGFMNGTHYHWYNEAWDEFECLCCEVHFFDCVEQIKFEEF